MYCQEGQNPLHPAQNLRNPFGCPRPLCMSQLAQRGSTRITNLLAPGRVCIFCRPVQRCPRKVSLCTKPSKRRPRWEDFDFGRRRCLLHCLPRAQGTPLKVSTELNKLNLRIVAICLLFLVSTLSVMFDAAKRFPRLGIADFHHACSCPYLPPNHTSSFGPF